MPFSLEERAALLALKGVGPTVITRLGQMGIESLIDVAQSEVGDILAPHDTTSLVLTRMFHLSRFTSSCIRAPIIPRNHSAWNAISSREIPSPNRYSKTLSLGP